MKRSILLVLAGLSLGLTSPALRANALVDGDWLQARLDDPEVLVLDVRSQIDGGSRARYERGHIPGAVHTDYPRDGWLSTAAGVRGMLPRADKLEALIGNLGIDEDVHVVVVPAGLSAADYASATRVYWTLKVAGHDRVSVLDGGHALWEQQGRPVQTGWVEPEPRLFEVAYRPQLVASREDVNAAIAAPASAQLVDHRDPGEFSGSASHPWVARAGAVPGARNLPADRFLDAAGRLATAADLRALWRATLGAGEAGIITYCNTGHLASLGWFVASEILGRRHVRLYDGSMVEWSADPALPVTARWNAAEAAAAPLR